ncbi:hypothetical protein LCGC14_1785240 [marine sediment metagenome]|uniref:Uncharacterized protein n=2 Tax=root TaxID=1 RepID=A0A7V1GFP1_9GAMM|nr:hypothetical protein [Pseudoalteromonas prydzensis]HEA18111.1 hypothetical protein [Pseudoalteromonas prydzensis]
MKLFIKALVFLLLFNSHSSFSGDWLSKQKISTVSFETGGFYLYSKEPWNNANNCSHTDAIVLQSNDANYDKAYSLLLMAFAAGKSVQGYSDGCVTHDGRTYNSIRGSKYLLVTD